MNQDIGLKLFPNPVSSQLNVSVNSIREGTFLHLYDMQGRIALKHAIEEGDNVLDITELEQGIYIAKLMSENQTVAVRRVVVMK